VGSEHEGGGDGEEEEEEDGGGASYYQPLRTGGKGFKGFNPMPGQKVRNTVMLLYAPGCWFSAGISGHPPHGALYSALVSHAHKISGALMAFVW
jgi:hypothetical protein